MELQLIAMRHSLAISDLDCEDSRRPLTEEGRRLAETTGRRLRELEVTPQLIIASSAVRTMETASLVANQFPPGIALVTTSELYMATADEYLPVIRQRAGDDVRSVLTIGHNPGIGRLIQALSGRSPAVPPATVGVFQITVDSWSDLHDLAETPATLQYFIVDGRVDVPERQRGSVSR